MNRTNLIPPRRRRAKARRRKLRAWAAGLSAYAAVLAAATALLLSGAIGGAAKTRPAATAALAREREAARTSADAQKQLVLLRGAIARSQQSSISAAAVTDSPDWSRLLTVVADSLGTDVVLDQCSCLAAPNQSAAGPPAPAARPDAPAAMAKPPAAPVLRQMVLHLSGSGRSQAAVADFVLRLEGLGLFQQVQLLQTTQTSTADGDVVSFNLDCPLRGVVEDPS